MSQYATAGNGASETYVWAQDASSVVNFVDAATGANLGSAIIRGQYGQTASNDITSQYPAGYILAAGDALNGHTQAVTPLVVGSSDQTLYLAKAPTIDISYVDDTDNGAVVLDRTLAGALGTTSNYNNSSDLADLATAGYVLSSSDVPASLTFDQDAATYTVHLTHKIDTVKGTDDTATDSQKKEADLTFQGQPIGTTLTASQVVPSGDLEQAVFLVRDKNVDEVLKAQGKPVSEYTTYGPWYAINDITPVTPATPEGYIPSVTEVDNLDSVIQNDITARQYVIAQATQISNKATDKVGGDFSLTMLISYTLMKYTEPIAYVDQTTGEPVGQIEKKFRARMIPLLFIQLLHQKGMKWSMVNQKL